MNSIKGNQGMDLADEDIPALKIEPCEDGTLMLEQDWCGNVDRIAIHPIHLRYMAEKLGMVPAVTAQEMEQANRAETWARRLRVLCGRISKLDEMLHAVPVYPKGKKDDPLNVYSQAARELAQEFCAELPGAERGAA
jgi:hypothetical protein